MKAEIFAEWFSRQGYQVIQSESSYWVNMGFRIFQAFPYHWLIDPSEKELRNIFFRNNVAALRYSTALNNLNGIQSYHVVCDNSNYHLKDLQRQARQNIKRGLASADIRTISMEKLATEGWKLRKETLERQGRTNAESEEQWRKLCLSADGLQGFEAWGAFCDGRLAASFLAFQCDEYYTLPYEQSATQYINLRVNNGIFYFVTQAALKRKNISSVFYGLQSLDAPPSVDQFKFRMGYTAKPVCQRVVFHPSISLLANNYSHWLIVKMLGRFQGNYTLAKAEGMLRFYLNEKGISKTT